MASSNTVGGRLPRFYGSNDHVFYPLDRASFAIAPPKIPAKTVLALGVAAHTTGLKEVLSGSEKMMQYHRHRVLPPEELRREDRLRLLAGQFGRLVNHLRGEGSARPIETYYNHIRSVRNAGRLVGMGAVHLGQSELEVQQICPERGIRKLAVVSGMQDFAANMYGEIVSVQGPKGDFAELLPRDVLHAVVAHIQGPNFKSALVPYA